MLLQCGRCLIRLNLSLSPIIDINQLSAVYLFIYSVTSVKTILLFQLHWHRIVPNTFYEIFLNILNIPTICFHMRVYYFEQIIIHVIIQSPLRSIFIHPHNHRAYMRCVSFAEISAFDNQENEECDGKSFNGTQFLDILFTFR